MTRSPAFTVARHWEEIVAKDILDSVDWVDDPHIVVTVRTRDDRHWIADIPKVGRFIQAGCIVTENSMSTEHHEVTGLQ